MARQRKKAMTWGQVAIANAGFKDAMKAFQFTMAWGLATSFLGREPESIEEYAEVAEVSRATAFREQQAFRKAFPTLEGPSEFNRRTNQQANYDEFIRSCRTMAEAKERSLGDVFSLGAAAFRAL